MVHKKLLALALASIVLISCKKDDPVPVQQPAKTTQERIMANPWKLTAWSATAAGSTEVQDFYALLLEDCVYDDQYRFKAQGILEYDDMHNRCDPAEPKVKNYAWTYTPATNKLRFAFLPLMEPEATVTVSNDSLIELDFEEELFGMAYRHHWVLKKY